MEIKKAEINDLNDLQLISRTTFSETFASSNSLADMQEYLNNNLSTEQLRKELLDNNSEFYFAVTNGQIIGYLKINWGNAQTEIKDEDALEVERIYVLKHYHGKEIGQALYAKALEIARELKMAYVWLGVWEKNSRAIKFYKKHGFNEFGEHSFKLGNDLQTDILMRLQL